MINNAAPEAAFPSQNDVITHQGRLTAASNGTMFSVISLIGVTRDETPPGGDQVVAHGASRTPKGAMFFSSGSTNQTTSTGLWDGSSNSNSFSIDPGNVTWGLSASLSIFDDQAVNPTTVYRGRISAVDATNHDHVDEIRLTNGTAHGEHVAILLIVLPPLFYCYKPPGL